MLLVLLLLLLGVAGNSHVRSHFFGISNLQDVARQIGLIGIFSIGECIVIITAGIDLSVGSLIGISGMICAMLLVQSGWPLWGAMLASTGIGLAIGLLHAFFITAFRMPPFIITLGTLDILRSAAQLMNGSNPIPLQEVATSGLILTLGSGYWMGVPIPFLLMIGLTIVGEIFMRRTALGRHVYALGGNEEATKLSGVRTVAVLFLAYGISAVLAAFTGILYAGYTTEGDPRLGMGYELTAIAAAVVGGCSLFGGEGSVIGAVIGAALLQVLVNVIVFYKSDNPTVWQGIVVGAVVIAAVTFNELRTWKQFGGLRGLIRRFR